MSWLNWRTAQRPRGTTDAGASAAAKGERMGWLRDLMVAGGVKSLDQLARAAIDHPHWPKGASPQPRSLAAILGRLDRGTDLEWLRERPQAQQALADILHCRASEIAERSGAEPRTESDTPARVRFPDLPGARSLDLTAVPLPPTIPALVAHPKHWQVHCWRGASGSGKSLTRLWLAARNLCRTARLDEAGWTEELEGEEPLFVDAVIPISETLFARLRARGRVLVAASHFATLVPPEVELATPSLADHLASTLDYFAPLLPRGLGEQRRAIETSLRVWLERGLLRTLADLIGMLGFFAAHGGEAPSDSSLSKLFRRALSERLDATLDRRDPRASMLKRNLPELLLAMHYGASHPARPLSEPRSFEDWVDTIPEEFRSGADLDWLRVQLASTDLGLWRRELDRAERQLPPGAHRLLSALGEAGMLQSVSPNLLALRPHFLVRLAEVLAERELLRRSPVEWGEALLDERQRCSVLRELEQRARRDATGLVDDLFELLDEQSPALVTAFESTSIVLGQLVLEGVELPAQLVAPLLTEMAALAYIDERGACRRRIGCRSCSHPLDVPGALPLALLALGELHPGCLERTRLFSAVTSPASYSAIFDLLVSWAAAPRELGSVFGLLDRLRHQIGVGADERAPHPLLLLGVVLDEVALDVLEWSTLEKYAMDQSWLELLALAATARGFAPEQLACAAFRAWVVAGAPSTGAVLLDHPQIMMARGATAEPTVSWLLGGAAVPLPLGRLPGAVWEAYLRRRADASDLSEERLEQLPTFVLEAILDSPIELPVSLFRCLSQRAPEACLARAERWRSTEPEQTAAWVRAFPSNQAPALQKAIERFKWTTAATPIVSAVRERLWTMVEGREGDFRRAYGLLVEIETMQRLLTRPLGTSGSP